MLYQLFTQGSLLTHHFFKNTSQIKKNNFQTCSPLLIAGQIAPEIKPEFLAPLENHTVIQGREVSFTCVVNHLQPYKVTIFPNFRTKKLEKKNS